MLTSSEEVGSQSKKSKIPSKQEKQHLKNHKIKSPDQSSKERPLVPPGKGKLSTHRRNERRRQKLLEEKLQTQEPEIEVDQTPSLKQQNLSAIKRMIRHGIAGNPPMDYEAERERIRLEKVKANLEWRQPQQLLESLVNSKTIQKPKITIRAFECEQDGVTNEINPPPLPFVEKKKKNKSKLSKTSNHVQDHKESLVAMEGTSRKKRKVDEEADSSPTLPQLPANCDSLRKLPGPPPANSVVAFKEVELDARSTPSISSYKTAKVFKVRMDKNDEMYVHLQMAKQDRRNIADEEGGGDGDQVEDDGMRQLRLTDMIDLRLVQRL